MSIDGQHNFTPGEYIRDELEARGWMQDDLAEIMGRPLKSVNQIIAGTKAITPQTAKELAAAFGTSAELWMNLEIAFRLSKETSDASQIARRSAIFDSVPVREMVRRRWIRDTRDADALGAEVDSFLSSSGFAAAARKSTSYETTTPSQRAWLCRAFQLSERVSAESFDAARAKRLLPKLHALTASEQEARNVPQMLAGMGIRFLVVEHLQRTKIDGAAFWRDGVPVVVLSLRYDRIDCFWHTLVHELSHIFHKDDWAVDDDLVSVDRIGAEGNAAAEVRADSDASNFLIPREVLDSFIARHKPRFSKANIIRFANLHQIHPGIVVGQLQYRKAIKYTHSREMLAPIRQILTDVAFTDGWGHFPG